MALDEKLRSELALPFGEVLPAINALDRIWKVRPSLLVAVGDDTIYRLLKNGVKPDIGVFDLRCQRMPLDTEMENEILEASEGAQEAENPAGQVTPALSAAVEMALMQRGGWIRVDGEDDLAALVFFAKAPDGAVILYGQPKEGMVWVEAGEALRQRALGLLIKIRGARQGQA